MFQGVIPGTTLPAFITEISSRKHCGTLHCKFDGFDKRVNFWHGKVISASSTLIDDRLGEIVYREGKLTLDAFIDAAAKVTKEMRFGDLLIKRKIFTEIDLWNALNSQSRSILDSLCFYKEIDVRFEEHQNSPKMEMLVQFEVDQIFEKALAELQEIEIFEQEARKKPALVLDTRAAHLLTDDFQRDMVGLVQDSADFNTIVDSTSRLSPIYTVRALYRLLVRGLLEDTWQLGRQNLLEETQKALQQTIEDANFMLAELANAAKMEQITEWEVILARASEVLTKDLGDGVFISPSDGFLEHNIVRAAVLQKKIRNKFYLQFSQSWSSSFVKHVHEAIYASMLFILFELYNRKFNSKEFARVKTMIDEMRNPLKT